LLRGDINFFDQARNYLYGIGNYSGGANKNR
jgi:hypothetical protein